MNILGNKTIRSLFAPLKRSGGYLLTLSLVSAVFFLSAGSAIGGVANTKHNLGSYSPGTVKSPDTTQVCIFCHTPHSANATGPIWNQTASAETYVIYATGTIVAAPGQPTGSSKLCLSCHDGTIALGSLSNLAGPDTSGSYSITGGTGEGKLGTTSTANLTNDLSNDHPVSFTYSSSYPSNDQIAATSTFPNVSEGDPETMKLANGYLQCSTCHDPHGTSFDLFLTEDLDQAVICTTCHVTDNWTNSIHKTENTLTWNSTGPNPFHVDLGASTGYTDDTTKDHGCLACHRSHGGAAGKVLSKGVNPGVSSQTGEEWTCINCHNGNLVTDDIEDYLDGIGKAYGHPTMGASFYGKHDPSRATASSPAREDATNLGDNRHAECVDCHGSHGMQSGNHIIGGTYGYTIGNNLIGSWGVKPASGWTDAGSGSDNRVTSYTIQDLDNSTLGSENLEGYVCMKCHSYYAYTTTPPVTETMINGVNPCEADVSGDFNTNNIGFHPVFGQGVYRPPATKNDLWGANGLTDTFAYNYWSGTGSRTGFYKVKHTDTITCSDCHASDLSSDLQGPHGSDNAFILRGYEGTNTNVATKTNFCYNCHSVDVYGDEDYDPPYKDLSRVDHPVDAGAAIDSPFYQSETTSTDPTTGNGANAFGNLCMTCHGGAYLDYFVAAGRVPALDTTTVIAGIHGNNTITEDTTVADDIDLGYRLMNGACIDTFKPSTTTDHGKIVFRTPEVDDVVCNHAFGQVNENKNRTNYNCTSFATCNP